MSELIRRAILAPQTTEHISYKIASTCDDRERAFRLVYHSYIEAGLTDRNCYQMRVSPHHLLPTTQTFVAIVGGGEVVFTASLVSDGALGLPMESIYPKEIAQRRQQGHHLAEVTCLADRRSHFRNFFPVFLRLSRLMVQYARRQQLDQLLVAIHPRHAGFYRRLLRFEAIGDQRDYPTVRNQPAIPMVLDLAAAKEKYPDDYETFFGERISDDLLQPEPITQAQRDYFSPIVAATYEEVLESEAVY